MVAEYGMSEELGPVSFAEGGEVFLGRDLNRVRQFSQNTARLIDDEVRRMLEEAYRLANTVLRQNIHILHRMAQILLEKETVEGAEFEEVVSGLNPVYPVPDPAPA